MSPGRPGDEGGTGLACVALNQLLSVHSHSMLFNMELRATSVLLLFITIIILTSTEGQNQTDLTSPSSLPLYILDAKCNIDLFR